MRQWTSMPTPLLTPGEDNAAAPLSGGRAYRVENGLFTGQGNVVQVPDWRVSGTCTDGAAENDAVCYGFPFATQGGASAESAGVAFSFDASGDAIYLHQLGEEGSILRTLTAYSAYVEAKPPQMTGFDMFGRAYFCADGREAVASRKGLAYFDPTAGGTVTIPTFDLGGGAAALRFKGIAKHRGATILGWGYQSNTTPDVPAFMRFCKYGDPTTWIPDGTPSSAGGFNVGTPSLPIIACAASGPYTVIGKSSEIFALDGDYEDQFSLQQIGTSHGPVSVNGIASNGELCVWMSAQGPAYSLNGGAVKLLAHPRVLRRMSTYMDLSYVCAAHDAENTRFLFLMRRGTDLAGTGLSDLWGTQLLCWDYERDAISIHDTPTTCFCVFPIQGPGVTFAAPSGTPSSLAASVTSSSASLSWSHSGGDATAQVSVEYRLTGLGPYTAAGPTAAGAVAWLLSGLREGSDYEWRLRYFKNGQYGSYTAVQTFTTDASGGVGTPSSFTGAVTNAYSFGGKTYSTVTFGWTQGEFASGAQTDLFENTINVFASASFAATMSASTTGTSLDKEQSVTDYYYWVRHRLADGTTGTEVACTDNPIVYGPP